MYEEYIQDIRKCDICGREDEVQVFASQLGAVSFAYCKECFSESAEPKGIIEGTIELSEGNVAPWVLQLHYYDRETGEYVSAKVLKEAYDKGARFFDLSELE